MSEIQNMIEQEIMEQEEDKSEGEFSFHVEENDKYGWYTVSLDLDKKINPSDCSLEFHVLKDGGRIFMFRTKQRYYESTQKNITPSRITQLSHIEHKLFRLYSGGATITVDELDFDNYWSRYN